MHKNGSRAYTQKNNEATQWKTKVEEFKATLEEQKSAIEELEEENNQLRRAHGMVVRNMITTQLNSKSYYRAHSLPLPCVKEGKVRATT